MKLHDKQIYSLHDIAGSSTDYITNYLKQAHNVLKETNRILNLLTLKRGGKTKRNRRNRRTRKNNTRKIRKQF